jgi:hypothetical protein
MRFVESINENIEMTKTIRSRVVVERNYDLDAKIISKTPSSKQDFGGKTFRIFSSSNSSSNSEAEIEFPTITVPHQAILKLKILNIPASSNSEAEIEFPKILNILLTPML